MPETPCIYFMDKNQDSAVKQFLEGTNDNMFDQSKDPFADVTIEQKEEPIEEKEEKPLPYHKDPSLQRYIDKKVKEGLGSREEKEDKPQAVDDFKDVVDSFRTIIGDNTPEKVRALETLQKSLNNLDQKAAQRAEEKIEEIAQRESMADEEAEQELESAFESIEENFNVDLTSSGSRKTRQEFVAFVEKIAPKDRNGDVIDFPDMNSAWETFSEMKKSTPNRAKELASRSMARSTGTATVQPKRVDWNAVDDFMDTLK